MDDVDIMNKGFTYINMRELYRKGIQCIGNVWNSQNGIWISWEVAQDKFHMVDADCDGWNTLISKILSKWSHMLGKDWERSIGCTN